MPKMAHGLALLLATILTACVAQQGRVGASIEPGTPISLTQAQIDAVKLGVASKLKDPYSAMFGEIRGAKDNSGLINVCGIVNSKNSFGGYVGNTPFYGILISKDNKNSFGLMQLGQSDIDYAVVAQMCAKTGVI